jgi:hypothetical protein
MRVAQYISMNCSIIICYITLASSLYPPRCVASVRSLIMGISLSTGTNRDKKKRGGLLGTLHSKWSKKITFFFYASFEGSQAVLACPSHRSTFERGRVLGSEVVKFWDVDFLWAEETNWARALMCMISTDCNIYFGRATLWWNFDVILEGYFRAKFIVIMGRVHAVQCEIRVRTQHLFYDQEKPRKSLIKFVTAVSLI